MALYEHKDAQLGDIEGTGYLFRRQTAFGDQYQGVFIAPEESSEQLVELKEQDEITFSGVAYKKNRSGNVSTDNVEYNVDITSVATVAMGERALVEVVEED